MSEAVGEGFDSTIGIGQIPDRKKVMAATGLAKESHPLREAFAHIIDVVTLPNVRICRSLLKGEEKYGQTVGRYAETTGNQTVLEAAQRSLGTINRVRKEIISSWVGHEVTELGFGLERVFVAPPKILAQLRGRDPYTIMPFGILYAALGVDRLIMINSDCLKDKYRPFWEQGLGHELGHAGAKKQPDWIKTWANFAEGTNVYFSEWLPLTLPNPPHWTERYHPPEEAEADDYAQAAVGVEKLIGVLDKNQKGLGKKLLAEFWLNQNPDPIVTHYENAFGKGSFRTFLREEVMGWKKKVSL